MTTSTTITTFSVSRTNGLTFFAPKTRLKRMFFPGIFMKDFLNLYKTSKMAVSEIHLYEVLASKLGKEEAKNLVEFVELKTEKKLDEKTSVFATKEDVHTLENALKSDISELKVEIAQSKVDIIRWVIGTAIALAGLNIAVSKFL